jgi:hypothetical protein
MKLYLLDFVFHLINLLGKKVADRKDDLYELIEHFNVSIFPIIQKNYLHFFFLGFVHIYEAY